MDVPLDRETLAGLAANDAEAGGEFVAVGWLESEIGYGIAHFGDRLAGTRNLGFALSDSRVHEYRIRWRLRLAESGRNARARRRVTDYRLLVGARRRALKDAQNDPNSKHQHTHQLNTYINSTHPTQETSSI